MEGWGDARSCARGTKRMHRAQARAPIIPFKEAMQHRIAMHHTCVL